MDARRLDQFPVHLGPGASAAALPEYTGTADWYEAYAAAHAGEGPEGRLVSQHRFEQSWDSWEMHPAGDELVICTEGTITLIQEAADGSNRAQVLGAGDYAINPAGVWHTADVSGPCCTIFVTAGWDTRHRPRG